MPRPRRKRSSVSTRRSSWWARAIQPGRRSWPCRATPGACMFVARGHDLGKSMSRYLVDRVENIANVEIHRGAAVTALEGAGHLEAVRVRHETGGETRIPTGS